MTVDEYIEAQHQARLALLVCAKCIAGRNDLIRHAAALGIPKTEIARILGMNRGHISEIANRKQEAGADLHSLRGIAYLRLVGSRHDRGQ